MTAPRSFQSGTSAANQARSSSDIGGSSDPPGTAGLVDEVDLHILPVLLGDGIRLYDNQGGKPVRLHRAGDGDPLAAVNVRYRPVA